MQRFSLLAASLLLASPAIAQPYPDKGDRREDGMTEQRREMMRHGEASVPQQNRESRRGDALEEMQGRREWLKEAQDALRAGQPGQANEYLERAATRLLSRSIEPSRAGEPMRDNRLMHIAGAREALYRRDRREAERQIEMAIRAD